MLFSAFLINNLISQQQWNHLQETRFYTPLKWLVCLQTIAAFFPERSSLYEDYFFVTYHKMGPGPWQAIDANISERVFPVWCFNNYSVFRVAITIFLAYICTDIEISVKGWTRWNPPDWNSWVLQKEHSNILIPYTWHMRFSNSRY